MGSQQQMQSLQLQTGEAGALFSQWMKSSNLLYLLVPADSKETCGHVPVPQKWEVGNIPNTLLALESSLADCSILHWGWLYALYTKLCRLCQYVRLWILFTKHLCISQSFAYLLVMNLVILYWLLFFSHLLSLLFSTFFKSKTQILFIFFSMPNMVPPIVTKSNYFMRT